MACRNLFDGLHSKIIVGKSNYEAGKKCCRRCEAFLYHNGTFCPCCGMALKATPTSRKDKEKLRQNQKLRLLLQGLMNEE
jgi:predicted amidophosphoribosyltransferase